MCARSAPYRNCKRPALRKYSWLIAHHTHEDILQRALPRLQFGKADADLIEPAQQRRYAGTFISRLEGVPQFAAVGVELEVPVSERGRNCGERLQQMQRELLVAALLP